MLCFCNSYHALYLLISERWAVHWMLLEPSVCSSRCKIHYIFCIWIYLVTFDSSAVEAIRSAWLGRSWKIFYLGRCATSQFPVLWYSCKFSCHSQTATVRIYLILIWIHGQNYIYNWFAFKRTQQLLIVYWWLLFFYFIRHLHWKAFPLEQQPFFYRSLGLPSGHMFSIDDFSTCIDSKKLESLLMQPAFPICLTIELRGPEIHYWKL